MTMTNVATAFCLLLVAAYGVWCVAELRRMRRDRPLKGEDHHARN